MGRPGSAATIPTAPFTISGRANCVNRAPAGGRRLRPGAAPRAPGSTRLQAGRVRLIGSDGNAAFPAVPGDTIAISLAWPDMDGLTKAFPAPAAGGTIKQPLTGGALGDCWLAHRHVRDRVERRHRGPSVRRSRGPSIRCQPSYSVDPTDVTRRHAMEARPTNDITPPILVTGGTGTIGRRVVARLRDAGRTVRVLSRGKRSQEGGPGVEFVTADLETGDGVDPALESVEVVIHLAGSAKGDDVKTQHLVDAAKRAGVRHLVYISVVGADLVPVESGLDRAMFGYFAAKAAAERIVASSGLPWSTLRATQVHESTFATVRGMARLPLIPVPSGFRFQPVDAGEVADRLVELALGEPAGLAPDLGGPRDYAMTDLVRSYLRAAGKRRPIIGMPLPGRAAAAMRAGANLAPDRAVGRRTWEEFLAARLGSPIDRRPDASVKAANTK
jgi:uncharacterized protein YbjT (DUF2867 family)